MADKSFDCIVKLNCKTAYMTLESNQDTSLSI